jgi:hypothetical protein
MRHAEIEYWALGVIGTIEAGGRVEDARVELKARFLDPVKAARRIAGHANAARGDEVLWILGVDEQMGVVGVNPDDLAGWWQQVASHFDGPVPISTPVEVHRNSVIVLALLLETTAAPYVVKNPAFGTKEGGPVQREVPWREMTAVRSAEHGDLIRLLVPRLRLPTIEVIDARLVGQRHDPDSRRVVSDFGKDFKWSATLTLYVVPQTRELLVFPAHHIQLVVRDLTGLGDLSLDYYGFRPMAQGHIGDSSVDVVVDQPARVDIRAAAKYEDSGPVGTQVTLVVGLRPAGSDQQVVVNCNLRQTRPNQFTLVKAIVAKVDRRSGAQAASSRAAL